MHSDSFEEAYGKFLESPEYELASEGLFKAVRAAFEAGWQAAIGTIPIEKRIFSLPRTGEEKQET